MNTAVPSPSFTATGFQVASSDAILTGVKADISAAFQTALNFNLNTPQGQLASSEAAIIANTQAMFVTYTQLIDPAYSFGRFQDAIARLYFLERDPAEPTTLQVVCGGGVTIPAGATIIDTSGNIYAATDGGALPATLTFAAVVAGPTAVPDAGGVGIYQVIPGWDTVSVASGVIGSNQETRQAFEARRADTVAGNSFGPIGAIIGAVAKVSGVLDYYGYNNNTASPVTISGVVIAANAIYIAVSGGTDAAVAQAILDKKSGGAPMVGSTIVTAYDSNPLYAAPIPYTIKFKRPADLQILFNVVIATGSTVPSDAATQIQAALISAFGGNFAGLSKARIASVLYATAYVSPIAALGSWALVTSIGIGSNLTPGATFTASIAGTLMTVTAVASGTLAVGQHLTDAAGAIINGTKILSQASGSAGSTGTYNIDQTQTITSRTVKGSSGNQSLVTVQADQEPQLVAVNIDVTIS